MCEAPSVEAQPRLGHVNEADTRMLVERAKEMKGPPLLQAKVFKSLVIYVPTEKSPGITDDTKKTFLSIGTRERRAEVKKRAGRAKLWR